MILGFSHRVIFHSMCLGGRQFFLKKTLGWGKTEQLAQWTLAQRKRGGGAVVIATDSHYAVGTQLMVVEGGYPSRSVVDELLHALSS
jgi:hypothetical protein